MATLPESVARYRTQYRGQVIGPRYRGALHLAFTLTFGLISMGWCITRLKRPSALEWTTLPLTFLYANFSEYWGHRVPMHRPVPGLGLVYRRHAGQHHRFFTDAAMSLEGWGDLKAVLFPPLLMSFFITAFALPVGALLALVFSPNVAYLFVATALGYFLNYEILHLAYHLPERHPLARLPLIPTLRRLHHRHHDPSLMTKRNFNITYPICDWLFRTLA
jgi:hypothetical protein